MAGRCVQVSASEIAVTGGNFGPAGRVVDHWTMHPAHMDGDGRYQATAVAVDAGTDAEPSYLIVVTSSDSYLLRDLHRANLPADMGVSVDAVVVLPKRVQTDQGARQVMRRMMMCAAQDEIPMMLGDMGYDRAIWQATAHGIVAGLTTAPEAE